MKDLINKYYKLYIDVFKDKKITTIMAYGFMLCNFAVGVGDLCLNRYVDSTYILSAGRW